MKTLEKNDEFLRAGFKHAENGMELKSGIGGSKLEVVGYDKKNKLFVVPDLH